tara:strand:+ start:19721 stop:19930 length:210 start_codon:yes stop_codon:yes gene_type:complete
MPDWTFYVALALAFIGALAVQAFVSVESTKRGDGLIKMWIKSGCLGALAMIGIIGAFLLVANAMNSFGG